MRFPVVLAVLLLPLAACGDSSLSVPKTLEAAHVDVARVKPELTRYGADSRLGAVWGLAQGPADTGMLAVGDAFCRIASTDATAECFPSPVAMESVHAIINDSGHVAGVVVSGQFGKPSAARLSPTGELVWRYDGDVRNMGSIAIADLADGPAVIVSGSDSIAILDFATGKIKSRRTKGRALLGANWIGGSTREYLLGTSDSTFNLIGPSGSTLAALTLPTGSWIEPVMTPVVAANERPYLVSSAGTTISVYDSLLAPVRTFQAPALVAPLHVVAAAFLTNDPKGPFAAVYNAANNWHRSVLCVFGSDGSVAYAEVLEDDHHVLRPRPDPTGLTFLLGGRGVVWQYRFPIGL
ncbi:MAG: hypothetical protein K2R93_03090 [Gemmatimonadaceae bacterium]|nr:hypothetical protein [Gemmatimonadaceae bacterium]